MMLEGAYRGVSPTATSSRSTSFFEKVFTRQISSKDES
jgi:hypothetical protein